MGRLVGLGVSSFFVGDKVTGGSEGAGVIGGSDGAAVSTGVGLGVCLYIYESKRSLDRSYGKVHNLSFHVKQYIPQMLVLD